MKFKRIITAALSSILLVTAFAGCQGKGESSLNDSESVVEAKIKVSYFDSDGTTMLQSAEIDKGGKAAEFAPEKDGFNFTGWFATPQLTRKFDFTAALNEDTSIFAGFTKFQEDTREFAIVGSGTSPLLLESNWGTVITDKHKLSKADDKNEYTITLDLYEGDAFQFAINTEWHNQRGFGYLESIEQDGKEYFKNAGSLGDASAKRSNIEVAVTGNYTFTLITNPAEDVYETDNTNYTEETKEKFNTNAYDKILFTYNGETKEKVAESKTDYYIKGAKITGWEDEYSDKTRFTEENGIYTLAATLEKDDEFMFTSMVTVGDSTTVGTEYLRFTNLDEASAALFTGLENGNIVVNEGGDCTFTYDPSTTVLTASKQ